MKQPFVPLSFPIEENYIDFPELLNELSNASMSIGELNIKMKQERWKSTYAVKHMMKLESLYSTRIEGTQTTIEAVYEAEADEKTEKQSNDIKEVLRYSQALCLAGEHVKTEPITNTLMRKIHYILLDGEVRKNSNFIAGEFRTQQNRVGDHIPPVASDVGKWMGNLERYINNDYGYEDKIPPIIKAALIHAQFETIHPFPDGNGRVGRVLIPIYLYKQNIIESPYFFLSQELERNRMRYYSYLQGTRSLTKDGFTKWIRFFLESVSNQAKRDVKFINDLEKLSEKTIQQAKERINSNKVDTVIDALFNQPIFTVDSLHRITQISKNTLRNYIRVLLELNILFKDQKRRNSKYYFMELIDLLG